MLCLSNALPCPVQFITTFVLAATNKTELAKLQAVLQALAANPSLAFTPALLAALGISSVQVIGIPPASITQPPPLPSPPSFTPASVDNASGSSSSKAHPLARVIAPTVIVPVVVLAMAGVGYWVWRKKSMSVSGGSAKARTPAGTRETNVHNPMHSSHV